MVKSFEAGNVYFNKSKEEIYSVNKFDNYFGETVCVETFKPINDHMYEDDGSCLAIRHVTQEQLDNSVLLKENEYIKTGQFEGGGDVPYHICLLRNEELEEFLNKQPITVKIFKEAMRKFPEFSYSKF